MKLAIQICDALERIQLRNKFSDQELAEHVGVNRSTIWRIRNGKLGETVSTKLVTIVFEEQPQQLTQQAL